MKTSKRITGTGNKRNRAGKRLKSSGRKSLFSDFEAIYAGITLMYNQEICDIDRFLQKAQQDAAANAG